MPRVPLPARVCAGLFAGALLTAGVGSTTSSAAAPPAPAPAAAHAGDATSATAPAAEEGSALRVTIRRMTPGALPERGPIRVRGSLTNVSDETWTDIQVFPFAGEAAMTTAEELVTAAGTEPTAVVGPRITDVRQDVEELAPGERVDYVLRVPRRFIDIDTPGIHWFGVHALGQSDSIPRDNVADGRARTFLPYLPDPGAAVETAIVVPVRQQVAYGARGAVADPKTWQRSLTRGALRHALDFGTADDAQPVTWVLDPAVPDALHQLAIANPVRSVSPTIVPEDEDDPEDPNTQQEAVADTPLAQAADAWLSRAERVLNGEEVMLLPWGDLDVAAAATHAPDLYSLARERTGTQVTDWDIATTPVVGSPSGYLNGAGVALVDDDALILLTDRMFGPEAFPNGTPSVVSVDGHRAVVTSYDAASGGPGPDKRRAPVALRQRLLAEAAVRLLSAPEEVAPDPLVLQLPPEFTGNPDFFWEGLDQDWLSFTTVTDLADGSATGVDSEDLTYPPRQERLELDGAVFDQVDQVRADAPVLQRLYALNETVGERLVDEALTFVGYTHRDNLAATLARLTGVEQWIHRRLAAISLEGPDAVNLSSESGRFVVTLRNKLAQPATVRVTAANTDGVSIEEIAPVVIPAEGHVTVEVHPHTDGTGVHDLTLRVTDTEGTPIGADTTVPVRSSQVGVVIWWILGAGGAILVVAIALRLYRRIRGVPPAAEQAAP